MHTARLRPTNYTRNAFHVASGVAVMLLIQHVLSPFGLQIVAGSATVAAWAAEVARRADPRVNRGLMALFGKVAHPHERRKVNSATWYVTALFALSLFAPPLVATLAVIVLAIGDPAAAIVGRRFGRIRILGDRSLEGSLAFVGAGALASLAVLAIYAPTYSWNLVAALAVAGALAGAVAEAISKRVDDNLTVPMSVGVVLTALLTITGT